MLRYWAALLVLTLALTGCQAARRPTENPTSSQTPAPAVDPTVPPCQGVAKGVPSTQIRIGTATVALPLTDCRTTVPAGQITLALQVKSGDLGKHIGVTGADGGRWAEDGQFLIDVKVEQDKSLTLALALERVGGPEKLTYILTGEAAMGDTLATAPGRQGPWIPVPASGFVPGEHTWLRIRYPRPMKAGAEAPVAIHQYGKDLLSGTWEGDRTQYVDLATAKGSIVWLRGTPDADGLQVAWPGVTTLYRGTPPQLQRVTPADQKARVVHQFAEEVPSFLKLEGNRVTYTLYDRKRQKETGRGAIDLSTGKVSTGPAESAGFRTSPFQFPSPDGRLVAELDFGTDDKGMYYFAQKHYQGTLLIKEADTGKVLLRQEKWLGSFGGDGCSRQDPAFAWRPDSGAVAAMDLVAKDRAVLKVTDLKGTTTLLAEQEGKTVSSDQFWRQVSWSPSGTMILFGRQVVEASTGRLLAVGMTQYVFWSPDSRYVLLFEPDHPFTRWGVMELVEMSTGKRHSLGHGQGLGWTKAGEAVILRWDLIKHLPPPPKGCA